MFTLWATYDPRNTFDSNGLDILLYLLLFSSFLLLLFDALNRRFNFFCHQFRDIAHKKQRRYCNNNKRYHTPPCNAISPRINPATFHRRCFNHCRRDSRYFLQGLLRSLGLDCTNQFGGWITRQSGLDCGRGDSTVQVIMDISIRYSSNDCCSKCSSYRSCGVRQSRGSGKILVRRGILNER